jgi:hypothetical protein
VEVRILYRVLGGVRGRQRHGDDEVRGREPEQDQHENLAGPAGEQVLQHRDRPLAGVGAAGDLDINREGADQGDEDEDGRGERREGAGGQERDAGLVAEGGEVVHASEPDHAPPRVRRKPSPGVELAHAEQPPPDGGAGLQRRLWQRPPEGDPGVIGRSREFLPARHLAPPGGRAQARTRTQGGPARRRDRTEGATRRDLLRPWVEGRARVRGDSGLDRVDPCVLPY